MITRRDYRASLPPQVAVRTVHLPDEHGLLRVDIAQLLNEETVDRELIPNYLYRKVIVCREDGGWTEYTRKEDSGD